MIYYLLSEFAIMHELHFSWLTEAEFTHDVKWWDIYVNSFPLEEQDSKEQLLKAMQCYNAKIGKFCLQQETAAIAVIYMMENPSFAFLHFFAVAEMLRNKGLGGQLLETLVKDSEAILLDRTQTSLGLIWEVEDPAAVTDQAEVLMRQRRIHFYEKHQAVFLQYPFIQPPIDGVNVVKMNLMFKSAVTSVLRQQDELDILNALYYKKYYLVNGTDERVIQELLQRCLGR